MPEGSRTSRRLATRKPEQKPNADGCEGNRMATKTKTHVANRIPVIDLLSLAFLNMRRHGLRAAVNVSGIALAVAALVFFLSFYRGTYEGAMFSSVIDYATSHGQIMASGFDDDDSDVWLEAKNLLPESLARDNSLVSAAERGKKWAPTVTGRLMSPAFAGDGSRKAAVLLAGVDFRKEAKIFAIGDRMVSGTFGGGVVIGKRLAEILSLSVGDEIRVQASTADGAQNLDYWKIAGIYSTGYPSMDGTMVLMDLADAQAFLAADGKINKIYCTLAPRGNSLARERGIAAVEADSGRLAAQGLEFRSWRNHAKSIVMDAKMDGAFYAIFIAILLFLSLATMAGTMKVTVFERKREIGMLRASGWMRGEITEMFLFEALAIGIAGGAAGCLVGGLAALAIELRPIPVALSSGSFDIPNFSLTCDLAPRDLVISLAAGFATALLAGIAPARSGARMPILSAMSER
jgi:ABC-type lipoprotein release transport system permease subunit